jgi:hypothetical protein
LNRSIYLFLILSLIFLNSTKGQVYGFEVFLGQKKSGRMSINVTNYLNENQLMDIKMDFKSSNIAENRIQYFASSYFKKSILTDAEALLEYNTVLKERCLTKLSKNTYQIRRKDEAMEYSDKKISWILESLYLKEPTNISSIYSIRYGTFLEIRVIDTGVYSVKMPISGSVNFYYKNGDFIKSETIGNIQQMTIKPKQK